jgi:TM2 domain-containing membrane protein YozV
MSGRNRVTAALFAIFLGGLGVHKFYLGKAGQGILYLVFCWTFIPAIVSFIEGLIYLSMAEDAFQQKYS